MLVNFGRKFGVSVIAYAPVGSPMITTNSLVDDKILIEISVKYNANPGKIALAWNLSKGVQ